jgi:hypothetical protein
MLLLLLSVAGGHYLKKIKIKYISEPLFATILGVFAGLILHVTSNETIINNITNAFEKFFLILLLPPIIFERYFYIIKNEIAHII